MDTCFDSWNFSSPMTVSNPTGDGWTGQIVISERGKHSLIECDGCSGAPYSVAIAVDGDSSYTYRAPTRCLDGRTCNITWSLEERLIVCVAMTTGVSKNDEGTLIVKINGKVVAD